MVKQLSVVRKLTIETYPPYDLSCLPEMPNLKHLRMHGIVRKLPRLAKPLDLEWLEIYSCDPWYDAIPEYATRKLLVYNVTDRLIANLHRNSRLEYLTLYQGKLTSCRPLALCENLRTLRLTDCKKVTELSGLTGLRCIDIDSNQLQFDGTAVCEMPFLDVLSFYLRRASVELCPLEEAPSLKMLVLDAKSVTPSTWTKVDCVQTYCPECSITSVVKQRWVITLEKSLIDFAAVTLARCFTGDGFRRHGLVANISTLGRGELYQIAVSPPKKR